MVIGVKPEHWIREEDESDEIEKKDTLKWWREIGTRWYKQCTNVNRAGSLYLVLQLENNDIMLNWCVYGTFTLQTYFIGHAFMHLRHIWIYL